MDKRKSIRVPAIISGYISWQEAKIPIETFNVSMGGAGVCIKGEDWNRIKDSDLLEGSLEFPYHSTQFEAEICWASPVENSTNVGLKFLNRTPELIKQLVQFQPEEDPTDTDGSFNL